MAWWGRTHRANKDLHDEPRGIADLRRLERTRDLLAARARVDRTRLAIFAAGGFGAELRDEASRRSDVVLVDLDRLYRGD